MRRYPTLFGIGLVSLSLILTSPLFAGWEEGVAAFTSKPPNFEKAAAEFRQVVDQSPDGYRGHYMLGASLLRLNRKEEALTHLRKAYDLNPNDLSIKLELGRAYGAVRRYQEVANLLSSVDVTSLPAAQKSAFFQMRGEANLKTNREDAAFSDFGNLAKLMPKDAEVQYSYGAVALKADQLDAAVLALSEAVKLDTKNDPEKRKVLANALIKQGRTVTDKAAKKASYTRAAEVASQLVAASPTFEHLMLKMSAELGGGMYLQAVATGEQAQQKNGNDWLVPFYIGQAYTSAEQFDKAIAPLKKSLDMAQGEDKRKVWSQLGFTYEKQKKLPEAVQAYQAAGNASAAARVEQNKATADENAKIEQANASVRKLELEKLKLECEMAKLEGKGGKKCEDYNKLLAAGGGR